MDINTIITTATAQLTIEYFKPIFKKYGEELKNFLAKRTLRKVLMFQKKPGSKIPERITNRFRDVANTKTLQEYYTGLIACSYTHEEDDDEILILWNLVEETPTRVLLTHFFIYQAIYRAFKGTNNNLQLYSDRGKCSIYISSKNLQEVLQLKDVDSKKISKYLHYLKVKDLISTFAHGYPQQISAYTIDEKFYTNNSITSKELGCYITPSNLGAELYLAAHGIKNIAVAQFFQIIGLEQPDELIPMSRIGVRALPIET